MENGRIVKFVLNLRSSEQRNKILKEIIYKMINTFCNDEKWRAVAVPNSFTRT